MTTPSLKTSKPNGSPQRINIDWNSPALLSAVDWFVTQYSDDTKLNLSDLIVVVPTSRARRRFLQLLVQRAKADSLILTPPKLTTIGGLPELLYKQEKPLASELTRRMAWVQSLKRMDQEAILQVFPRLRTGETTDYMAAATMLQQLHTRLATDILSFYSVEKRIAAMSEFPETDRWHTLGGIQSHYYKILDEVGLWDQQAARSVAARTENQCSSEQPIILIGVADLNRSTRTMLEQIPDKVTSLVFCDPAHIDRFDDFGGIITERWLDAPIDLDDEKILMVEDPADQGYAIGAYLTNLNFELHADEITIGAPDPEIVPQIERSLSALGLESRDLSGKKFNQAACIRLLLAIKDFVKQKNFTTYAELIRHPDMFEFLNTKAELNGEWLTLLDEYQNKRLPGELDIETENQFPPVLVYDTPQPDHLNTIFGIVSDLLRPVWDWRRTLQEWADPWIQIILQIYGDRELDEQSLHDRLLIKSCQAINESFADHEEMPEAWETPLESYEALELAIQATTLGSLTDEPSHKAVDIAGWLDLPLDDAKVMIVTSFNDEYIPNVENADMFLPNHLCKQLGIVDNDRRYARDAYAVGMINAARKYLLLICGRKRVNKDPLVPSRLIMATDGRKVALRAKAFFSHPGSHGRRFWLGDRGHGSKLHQQFGVPNPADFDTMKPINKISVTKFKEYIDCKYRFYLGRIAKLQTSDDRAREMDGGAFGDLAHNVLCDFGVDKSIKDSSDKAKIAAYLSETLDEWAEKMFPHSKLPAVSVQIEQLRVRLEIFAEHQVHWRNQGWKIAYAEKYCTYDFDVDGKPFTITGIVDRVDQHETTGDIFIWDYKTSDAGQGPGEAHYTERRGWFNLQLPLYRHLIKALDFPGASDKTPDMGYIALPRDENRIRFESASEDWNDLMLAQADEKAKEVIRGLRALEFFPPNERPPKFSGDYAGICRENVFEKVVEVEEECF